MKRRTCTAGGVSARHRARWDSPHQPNHAEGLPATSGHIGPRYRAGGNPATTPSRVESSSRRSSIGHSTSRPRAGPLRFIDDRRICAKTLWSAGACSRSNERRLAAAPAVSAGSQRTSPLSAFRWARGGPDQARPGHCAQQSRQRPGPAAAARFWAEALAADPKLVDDRRSGHRYNAACAAALAGAGQGNDGPPPAAARTTLPEQARDWLKPERLSWTKLLESGIPQAGPAIVGTLTQTNPQSGIPRRRRLSRTQTGWRVP